MTKNDRADVRLVGFLAVCSLVWLGGCDSAPGPADPTASAPVVSEFVWSPEVVSVGSTAQTVPITASVTVSDADSDPERLYFIVRSPGGGLDAVGQTDVETPGPGRFEATFEVELPAGVSGMYSIVGVASDATGRLSNQVIGSIQVEAGGEPPVITQVDIPATVVRPADGEPPVIISIVAHVADPDGVDNVDRVDVTIGGASTLRMCDDGGVGTCNPGSGSGDAIAGDGQFTLTIQLDSNNSPGERTFDFVAVDKSGLVSESVSHTIDVQ